MKFSLFALTLPALISIPLWSSQEAFSSPGSATPAPAASSVSIDHELLVVYDWTGSTLTGPTHLSVDVYSDGVVKISGVTSTGGGDARVAHVGPEVVHELVRDLRAAKAWTLGDQEITFSDIPLKTLTVLRGSNASPNDKKAHTFNYWAGLDEYQSVELVMQLFIAVHFPGF